MENVFAFASLLAKRRILLEWKSNNPPKTLMWICDLILYLKLEKIQCQKRIHPKMLYNLETYYYIFWKDEDPTF